MISIEEFGIMLDEIAAEFPPEFYNELNGGILLLEESKLHPKHIDGDLFIMGEYHNNLSMGKYIVIYYGSFMRVYGNLPKERLRERLKKTLSHEFTHHLEYLSGERGLEKKDARNLARYTQGKRRE